MHCGNTTPSFTVLSGKLISNCVQTPETMAHALVLAPVTLYAMGEGG